MTDRGLLEPSEIVDLWRERFGEPPPIITDSETMLRIMRNSPPRSFAPPLAPAAKSEVTTFGLDGFLRQAGLGFDEPSLLGGEDTTP